MNPREVVAESTEFRPGVFGSIKGKSEAVRAMKEAREVVGMAGKLTRKGRGMEIPK